MKNTEHWQKQTGNN